MQKINWRYLISRQKMEIMAQPPCNDNDGIAIYNEAKNGK